MDKYVAMYASELMNNGERYLDAVKVFEQYGASANPQNFNIYKRLIDNVSLFNFNILEKYCCLVVEHTKYDI